MRPRDKSRARENDAGYLTLIVDPGKEMTLEDPDGKVSALLDLMDGSRSVIHIVQLLQESFPGISSQDVLSAIEGLDSAGLIDDAENDDLAPLSGWEMDRYFSNLAFFDGYSSLSKSRHGYQQMLLQSHVLLLGVGGLGSTVLFNLLGLGIGEITIVDCDKVELKNLSRQYLYNESDVGLAKIDRAIARAQAFNSHVTLNGIEKRVEGPDDIEDLLASGGISLVVSVIDQPLQVQDWVNQACVEARIPFITGGMYLGTGEYCSVNPHKSGCLSCYRIVASREQRGAHLLQQVSRVNRGIAPVASMIASFISLEALRYLTRFAEPVSAGRLLCIDFSSGRVTTEFSWDREPSCPLCANQYAPVTVSEHAG